MKKFLLSLCMVLALVACKEEKKTVATKPIVKIGAVLPLTSETAVLGDAARAGILAAIKDKSKENLKYDYKVVFEDNQHMPAKSATAAIKLINVDKVDMLLTFTTGVGRVVGPLAENADKLHVCSTLESIKAAPMGKTTFFQGPSLQSYQQIVMRALEKRGVTKLAMLASNFGVACSGTERLGEMLKEKGLDVSVECFNPSDRDFRMTIQKYTTQGYKYFYLQAWPPQTDILVRQLKEQNVLPQNIYGSGIDTGTDVTVFEGINHVGGNSGSPEFVNRLMEEYNLKNVYMAAAAYDLIALSIDAFENVDDKKNTEALEAYIKSHANRKCMSGDCLLYENGFIANEAEWRTYKDGKPVALED